MRWPVSSTWEATLCTDSTCPAEVHKKDCLSNGINGQTKEDPVVQHHQLFKQVQALQLSYHLSSMAVKHGPCLLTLRKRSRPLKPSAWGNFSASPTYSTRPVTGYGARSTPLWVHSKLLWQLSKDGSLHCSGTRHAMTASRKLSLKAPWRVGDAMVSSGNAGWTTPKSGHPCPCQNCSQGPPAEKTGRGSLLDHPPCPPNDPIWSTSPPPASWGRRVKMTVTSLLHIVCLVFGSSHQYKYETLHFGAIFSPPLAASRYH